jgi:uncharacterized protein involved in exopolysaccharide biosynthesis
MNLYRGLVEFLTLLVEIGISSTYDAQVRLLQAQNVARQTVDRAKLSSTDRADAVRR